MENQHRAPYVIREVATIADALSIITENKRGAVIVLGENDRLIGVVSDGDIRRALVKGATMLTPLGKIVNMNLLTVPEGPEAEEKGLSILGDHPEINLVPVTGESNKLVDIIVRSS